jgi:hypothetical protein
MATENRRGGVKWHLHRVETATAQQNENVGRPLHGGKNNAGAGQSGECRHLGPHVKERALCEAAEGVEEEEEEDEGEALRGRGGGGTGRESLGRGELRCGGGGGDIKLALLMKDVAAAGKRWRRRAMAVAQATVSST